MRTHKPIAEIAGELEEMGVPTYRATASRSCQLVISVMDSLYTVRVKNIHTQSEQNSIQLKFTSEERGAMPDLYAFYRNGAYLVEFEEAPDRSMSFTLSNPRQLDAANRKQANFLGDYEAKSFISRAMKEE